MTADAGPSVPTARTPGPDGLTPARTAPRAARRSALIAAAGFLVAELAIVAGNVNVPDGEKGGLVPASVTSAACLLLCAGLVVGVVRRRPGPGAALVLGILSLLSVAVFWSGIPLVLGFAALAVTSATDQRTGRVRAAQVLAIIGCVLALAANAVGSHLL